MNDRTSALAAVAPGNDASALDNQATARAQAASPRRQPIIAIDGPAGAGKSTIAAYLARRFRFLNLETGAMYRALALKALAHAVHLDDEAALAALCGTTEITLESTREGNRVLLDGVDVSKRLREPDVTSAASQVSVYPAVRSALVERQRALGAAGGVVMEGRDIGTAVFPDAEVKIFLDARAEVRGQRRFKQVAAAGRRQAEPAESPSEAEVLAEMRERDERDRERAESPLRAADDAVHVDSSALTLEQVKAACEALVRRWLEKAGE